MAYVITDKCVACGTCLPVCPVEAISEGDIYHIDPDTCISCGSCAAPQRRYRGGLTTATLTEHGVPKRTSFRFGTFSYASIAWLLGVLSPYMAWLTEKFAIFAS